MKYLIPLLFLLPACTTTRNVASTLSPEVCETQRDNNTLIALGDSDDDGLTNKQEIEILHTDPCNKDTDNDKLSDGFEYYLMIHGVLQMHNGLSPILNSSSMRNGILDSKRVYGSGTLLDLQKEWNEKN